MKRLQNKYSNVANKRTVLNNRTLGRQVFTNRVKSARALCFFHSLGPRDSKKFKFGHLEGHLVVSAQLKGLG